MMQVSASSSFSARNGSYNLLHLHHMPRGKDRSIRIGCASKKFLASTRQLHRRALKVGMFSSNTIVCGTQDRQASEWDRDEVRWLREEKRWLREEERWLREEGRWAVERKDLLEKNIAFKEEIRDLKLKIVQLESQLKDENAKDEALSDLIVSLTSLLQSLNMASSLGSEGQGSSSFQAQISSSGSTSTDIRSALGDLSLETLTQHITPVSQPSILELKDVATTSSRQPHSNERNKRTLKRGAEGDDVKAMQEALAKLGFYSGEDDMEYSTFSSGTERAVRSWQATVGALENGIVTTELLIKLLGEESSVIREKQASSSPSQVKVAPATAKGAAPTAGARSPVSDVKAKTSTSTGTEKPTGSKANSVSPKKPENTAVEAPQRRVYLLGENRWEEPDRLLSKNGPTAAVTSALNEKCFSCKGLGSTLCTECEGTGELNVEEQFLEWADEGAKCPYCEGKGSLDCDVCDGKGVRALA